MPFVLLAALLVAGCGDGVNRGDFNLMTVEQEWQLGSRLAAEAARALPLADDPALAGYVHRLGRPLAGATAFAERDWHFYVVADTSLNAFALPGGHVYVHAGLLAAAETPEALAGVLAHEVAHVAARHSTERLVKAYGLELVLGLVLGESAGLVEQLIAQLVGAGTLAKFSRDDEREADRLGLGLLAEAGYDPAGLAAFFETLLQAQRQQPGAVAQFFSTHPVTEARLADARAGAAERVPEGQARLPEGFEAARAQARRLVAAAR